MIKRIFGITPDILNPGNIMGFTESLKILDLVNAPNSIIA
ncbi:hypothetical protein DKAM_1311 [Desulfurococcus amylolyticus 1221n]|uniref:Uncharacterized protein n=1 Tax=Desulfurococcus amylolyticus (strain DSM 18924 / JCM 16383 / VKM B-2413 / 1221n) TaxID=490899 RepID=B8D6A6_DESA1|nr:hypothetical protein DKAM_1311 [Desulfurococcus amylolyticus 1221n]